MAFALTSGEKEDDFAWILEQLKDLARVQQIPDPQTIVTDFCRAFKNACAALFPSVQQQLCIWHVQKNVAYHVKKKWVGNGANLDGPDREEEDDDGDIPRGPQAPGPDEEADDEVEERLRIQAIEHAAAVNLAGATSTALLRAQEEADEAAAEPPPDDTALAENSASAPPAPATQRRWEDSHEGFMKAWQAVTSQPTEDGFWSMWRRLVKDFIRQLREYSHPQILLLLIHCSSPAQVPAKALPSLAFSVGSICHCQLSKLRHLR